jgi:hypothetical protein
VSQAHRIGFGREETRSQAVCRYDCALHIRTLLYYDAKAKGVQQKMCFLSEAGILARIFALVNESPWLSAGWFARRPFQWDERLGSRYVDDAILGDRGRLRGRGKRSLDLAFSLNLTLLIYCAHGQR